MTIANVIVASITLAIPTKSQRWTKVAVMNQTLLSKDGYILSKKDYVLIAQGLYKVILRALD